MHHAVLGDGYQRSPDGLIFKDFVEGSGELPVDGQVGRRRRRRLVGIAAPGRAHMAAVVVVSACMGRGVSKGGFISERVKEGS